MLLFHGSNCYFEEFDNSYIGSGEGSSQADFVGWYFASSLKGAEYHTTQKLPNKNSGGEWEYTGYIYVCLVDLEHLVGDVEKGWQDFGYHGEIIGVPLGKEKHIQIVERIPVKDVFKETNGDVKEYTLGKTKSALAGGYMSFLQRKK